MLQALRKGLTRAAENANAWLVTGGSNSGVMKLVGEVMSERLSSRRAPLIGVCACTHALCGVLCCAVLCCGVVCCAVLCCGVVWCAVLWCGVALTFAWLCDPEADFPSVFCRALSSALICRPTTLTRAANWGVLDLPKEATSPHFKDRLDINYTPSSSSGLDANHNFFLLVDSGCARFGGEISFRATLETRLAEPGTPIVLIVIQGGPNTIQ
jgi:hypothetical protein